MDPIRVAYVRYLNTRPLVEGLGVAEGAELIPAAPSHIADLVRTGAADVGLASIIDAAGPGEPLALLPVGMIGCDGATMTVRLYCSTPPDRVERIHTDVESHTSIALCRVILDRMHDRRPEFVPFDARERMAGTGPEEWPAAMLLIGDKVVTDSPPAVRYPYQLDLGEAWKLLTGLPFVYAMWMCRAREAGTAQIGAAAALLDRQLRHNLTRLDWITETRAPEHHWPADLARTYLGKLLRFQVGPREREAAERFIAETDRLGLTPGRGLSWVDWRSPLASAAGGVSARA